MKLRPYQRQAIDAAFERWLECDSTLVVCPTGSGKSYIAVSLWKEWIQRFGNGKRILFMAPRSELVRQTYDEFCVQFPADEIGIEMEQYTTLASAYLPPKIVIATVQTLWRENRRQNFDPKEFGLIVFDEAHHIVSASNRETVNYFTSGGAKLLCLTATPKRADDLALGQMIQSVAYEYLMPDAIEDGYLVPVRQKIVHVEGLDFSKLHTLAGDFNQAELEALVMEETPLHEMAASIVKILGDLPSLIFCVSIEHSKAIAAMLNRYKPSSAVALWGDNSQAGKKRREIAVQEFKKGTINYLCSCQLFLEGFNVPKAVAIAWCRSTQSIVVYEQGIGRCTRPLEEVAKALNDIPEASERRKLIEQSAKPYMIALDFVGNAGRHKIIQAQDVLGGKWGEPVRHHAKKIAQELQQADQGAVIDPDQTMAQAEDELAFLQLYNAEEERRKKIRASKVNYREEEISPFDNTVRIDRRQRKQKMVSADPATDKQVSRLLSWGYDSSRVKSMSKKEAGFWIGYEFKRRGVAR